MPQHWSRRLILAALLAGGASSSCLPAATVTGSAILPGTTPGGGAQQPAINVPPVSELGALVVFPSGSMAKLKASLRIQAAVPPSDLSVAEMARLRITVNGTVLSASQFAFTDLQLNGQGQLTASLRMTGLTPLQAATVEIANQAQSVVLRVRVPIGSAAAPFRMDLRSTALALIAEAVEKVGATPGPVDEAAVAALITQLQDAYTAAGQTSVLTQPAVMQQVQLIANSVQNGNGNGYGPGGINGGPGGPNASPTPTPSPTPMPAVVFPTGPAGTLFTVAGGNVGDGGPITSAFLGQPWWPAVDTLGNIYVTDYFCHRVRLMCKVSGAYFGQAMTAGNIYSVVGGGAVFGEGGPAQQASLESPTGLAIDAAGNLFIGDGTHYRIRMVPAVSGTYFGQAMIAHRIYTIAGNGTEGQVTNGALATATTIENADGTVAIDPDGNLYFTDGGRVAVVARQAGTYFGLAMTAGRVYAVAGAGTPGDVTDGLPALSTGFINLGGLTMDAGRNLYLSDVTGAGTYMIPATAGTYFGRVMGAGKSYRITTRHSASLVVDGAGNLYFGRTTPFPMAVLPTASGTILGQAVTANVLADLTTPSGTMTFDTAGNLYIAGGDINGTLGKRVFMVPKTAGSHFGQSMNAGTSYALIDGDQLAAVSPADGGIAAKAVFGDLSSMATDALGSLYLSEAGRVRMLAMSHGTAFGQTMTAGNVYTIAGTGAWGTTGDGGLATNARVSAGQIAVDPGGHVALTAGNAIRFVAAQAGTYYGQALGAGQIQTIVGGGASTAEGAAAASTALLNPGGLAYDADGTLLIAERNRVRAVPKRSGTYYGQAMTADNVYTIIGNGGPTFGGDGTAVLATGLEGASKLTVDRNGNLYIANSSYIYVIPKASGNLFGKTVTANRIYRISGNGSSTTPPMPENVLATTAGLNGSLGGIAVDDAGNLYLSDVDNFRIRRIDPQGLIATVAGSGDLIPGQAGDGGPGLSANMMWSYGLVYSPLWKAVLFNSYERVRGLYL